MSNTPDAAKRRQGKTRTVNQRAHSAYLALLSYERHRTPASWRHYWRMTCAVTGANSEVTPPEPATGVVVHSYTAMLYHLDMYKQT